MYMQDAGEPLDGSQNYRLHFASDPPVNAFCSLSMYEVAPDGRRFFRAFSRPKDYSRRSARL
jgi:hypothetical protein